METLVNRYKRLLAVTSTKRIRNLMNVIHWDARHRDCSFPIGGYPRPSR